MNKRIKTIIIIAAVFAGGLVAALTAYNSLSSRVAALNVSNVFAQGETVSVPVAVSTKSPDERQARDFTMLDQSGNTVKLSDYYGKPIVLNFWASWCPPCRSEMPAFEKLHEEKGDSLNVMMVNLTDGYREDTGSAMAFAEKNGYGFPLYFDTRGEGANGYGIMSIPTTVFINADGTLMETHMGSMSENVLYSYADALLNK